VGRRRTPRAVPACARLALTGPETLVARRAARRGRGWVATGGAQPVARSRHVAPPSWDSRMAPSSSTA
jgi:hypothetical protein